MILLEKGFVDCTLGVKETNVTHYCSDYLSALWPYLSLTTNESGLSYWIGQFRSSDQAVWLFPDCNEWIELPDQVV